MPKQDGQNLRTIMMQVDLLRTRISRLGLLSIKLGGCVLYRCVSQSLYRSASKKSGCSLAVHTPRGVVGIPPARIQPPRGAELLAAPHELL